MGATSVLEMSSITVPGLMEGPFITKLASMCTFGGVTLGNEVLACDIVAEIVADFGGEDEARHPRMKRAIKRRWKLRSLNPNLFNQVALGPWVQHSGYEAKRGAELQLQEPEAFSMNPPLEL